MGAGGRDPLSGAYLAGGYNRLRTDIAGRVVENEDLVNLPNWLCARFRIADGDWFDVRTVTILSYRQELDLRLGMLLRTIRFEDGQGRRVTLKERRLVSISDMHLGALELALIAENWSARVTVRSAIDGRNRQCGRQALSQIQQSTSGVAGRRGSRRRQRLVARPHLPIPYSDCADGANAKRSSAATH